jgi:hypothetical protein
LSKQALFKCQIKRQMATEYFSFTDLNIETGEIEELMGFEPGHSPAPFPELIDEGIKLVPKICQIEGGYQIFDQIGVDLNTNTIRIKDQVFFPGKIVVTQLIKASRAALFLCTAGNEITELSRQKSAEDDELMAYVLDVIGSVTVNTAAGMLQEKILKEVSTSGFSITDSFSPGYCSWSVAEQQKLFSLLPPGFCSISLSESSLMHPVKSVSGITGIGIGCERTGYQCNWCNDVNCIYGKTRRHKKAKKYL